jgi:hypothetical protein
LEGRSADLSLLNAAYTVFSLGKLANGIPFRFINKITIMKKFLFLTLIFGAVISTTTHAQGGDPAAILQQTKERVKPLMVEKTGLTEAQADRVIEINFEIRQAARGLRDLNETERSAKIAELKATKEKKYSEIPLTAEQIKAVNTFYEDMGKNMPQRSVN